MNESAVPHGFESKVRESFARQRVMGTIGAQLTRVEAGAVEIALPFRVDLTQQHGFTHAGIVATILDSAGGYAAFSLVAADLEVLTVEYKINLLRPATGDCLVARARVMRSGKTLTVCTGDVFAQANGAENLVATMLATIMAIPRRADLKG